LKRTRRQGFTLIEVLVVLVLAGLMGAMFYTFFRTNLNTYFSLQKDASGFTDLASQSQRVGNVLRGLTDIVSAGANDIVVYAYFYPSDTYVSLVHYYLSGDGKILYVDVTPMTANPPIGTPVTASKKTYTIIINFNQTAGLSLFTYLDASGNTLSLPITDLKTVKGIRVNMAVASTQPGVNQAMSLQVSLRNRKINL
jgi:prepilin-type N-terminal cleavage/methylation domain-containing protein